MAKPAMRVTEQDQGRVTFVEHKEPTPAELRQSRAQVQDLSVLRPSDQFLYMNDHPDGRSDVLNERMQELAPWIGRTTDGADGPFSDGGVDLTSVRQDTQRYVVRVKSCSDGAPVEVEGIRGRGEGRLNLAGVKDSSVLLYPGKTVGVEGRRLIDDGDTEAARSDIEVTALYDPVPLPLPAKGEPVEQDAKRARTRGGDDGAAAPDGPIGVVVAAGPYGKNSKETRALLQGLTEAAEARGASTLIIIGPLVEEREYDGTCYDDDVTEIGLYSEWLGEMALRRQHAFRKDPAQPDPAGIPTVCFVPSTRDVFHDYVYPQPAYDVNLDPGLDGPEMVLMLPNPATIRVGPVTIGITSADVLRHVKNALPVTAGAARSSAARAPPMLKRAAEEVVRSHCFYPLVPAAPECPLDYSLSRALAFARGATPDVLLLPSAVPHFADQVHLRGGDRAVVVNPGNFSRRSSEPQQRFVELRFAAGDSAVWRRATAQWWRVEPQMP